MEHTFTPRNVYKKITSHLIKRHGTGDRSLIADYPAARKCPASKSFWRGYLHPNLRLIADYKSVDLREMGEQIIRLQTNTNLHPIDILNLVKNLEITLLRSAFDFCLCNKERRSDGSELGG